MEEKRTAIAIFICIIIVMVYSELFLAPYSRQYQQAVEQKRSSTTVDGGQQTQASPSPSTAKPGSETLSAPDKITLQKKDHPTPAELAASAITRVQNAKVSLEINHLGGRIVSYKLREHFAKLPEKGKEPELYEMISKVEGSVMPLAVHSGGYSDDHVVYALTEASSGIREINGKYYLSGTEELSLTFKGIFPNGGEIEKVLKFTGNSYLFRVEVRLEKPALDGSRMWLEWSYFEPVEAVSRFNMHGFVYLGEKLEHLLGAKTPEVPKDLGNNVWIAYADKYFISALIPTVGGNNTRVVREGDVMLERAAGSPEGGAFNVYVGPKDYKLLKTVGFDLHRSVDLGVFAFLAHPLLELIRIFYRLFGNYGLAIILLTLIIKALFLPLTAKSFESMQGMQKIQPEIKALRERYKKDPTRMNQELMALYKKHGVNPLGGCLPILIQIPVFLGLYNALLNSIELRQAPFALWIKDLSVPERLSLWGMHLPVMVILMGISMFVQQWMTPSGMDPTQKKIMMLMPLMFVFIFLKFPAGLVLYWLVNNLISIVQQSYIRSGKAKQASRATAVASLGLFGFAYVLTLL